MNRCRWLSLPLVVPAAFIVGFMFGGAASQALGMWEEPVVGFCAALAVVLAGHHAVPTHRFAVSVVLLLAGGVTAYRLIGRSWYPEGYEKAYEPTYLPLLITFLGGLLGVAYSFLRTRMKTTSFAS